MVFGPSDTPSSLRQRRTPIFLAKSFSPRSIYPESEKKVKNSSLGFFGGVTSSDSLTHSGSVEPQFFWRNRFLKDRFTQKAKKNFEKKKNLSVAGLQSEKRPKRGTQGNGRHDSMSHPTPKFYGETLSWVHTTSQNFRSIRFS